LDGSLKFFTHIRRDVYDRDKKSFFSVSGGLGMICRITLVTNNPEFKSKVKDITFIDGSAWEVLVKSRDAVHLGGKLLNHPLYGNFRPYQQPYRSLVLQKNSNVSSVDLYSLGLMENALEVYRSCGDRILLPGMLAEEAERDCRYLDYQLVKHTLSQYGELDQG
jgi:hypothetical protein